MSEKQKWVLPGGRKGDEKPGEETPALMWMKDPLPRAGHGDWNTWVRGMAAR